MSTPPSSRPATATEKFRRTIVAIAVSAAAATATAEGAEDKTHAENAEIAESGLGSVEAKPSPSVAPAVTNAPATAATARTTDSADVEEVGLDPEWTYADRSAIHSGTAVLYRAPEGRKDVVVGVNAGHGTEGGQSVKTQCHPDGSPKVTGGTTAAGSVTAVAVSGGMTFADGTAEAQATLAAARLLRDKLLAKGYDVLMLRDGPDVQLDNVARTVMANNRADCLVSLHWDGDSLAYDKGCFYISTPDGIKGMEPVSEHWRDHERLGEALVEGLRGKGCRICGNGKSAVDLTQTSYSTIPSVDVELGNQASAHDDATLSTLAEGLLDGIALFFGQEQSARRNGEGR